MARVELDGPINVSFSTLAAMTVDGMVRRPILARRPALVRDCRAPDHLTSARRWQIGWKTTQQTHAYGQARRGQDTGCFLENFCAVVLPYLRPFPEPCSVVVLDNSRCDAWAGWGWLGWGWGPHRS